MCIFPLILNYKKGVGSLTNQTTSYLQDVYRQIWDLSHKLHVVETHIDIKNQK